MVASACNIQETTLSMNGSTDSRYIIAINKFVRSKCMHKRLSRDLEEAFFEFFGLAWGIIVLCMGKVSYSESV